MAIRRLNAAMKADVYPMPWIDGLLDQLDEARYISTLDLSRGYRQVPVAGKDYHKAAFTTPFGLFQFKVMPFGLCDVPVTFQCLMDNVLQGLDDTAAAYVYLDDLIIYSKTWEEQFTVKMVA